MDSDIRVIEVSGEMDPSPTLNGGAGGRFEFLHRIQDPKQWFSQQRNNVRPWLLFIATTNFKAPLSLPRLSRRLMRNIEYFQANYLYVFIGVVIYCLITSPLVLLALSISLYCGYKLQQRHLHHRKFSVMGRELTIAQLYGLVALFSMPIYYLVGAHGAMFWILGASFTLIMLHAAFYNIDAVRQDDLLLQQV